MFDDFLHQCLNSLIFSFLPSVSRQERDEMATAMATATAFFLLVAFFLLAARVDK